MNTYTYDKALHEWTKQWNNSIKEYFPITKQVKVGGVEMAFSDQWNKPSKGCVYSPLKIIVNGPATIVFWQDGTKTVVKCAKGESWDIYNAFTAALAIKIFGTNSKIKKILKTKIEWPDDFTLAVKED